MNRIPKDKSLMKSHKTISELKTIKELTEVNDSWSKEKAVYDYRLIEEESRAQRKSDRKLESYLDAA